MPLFQYQRDNTEWSGGGYTLNGSNSNAAAGPSRRPNAVNGSSSRLIDHKYQHQEEEEELDYDEEALLDVERAEAEEFQANDYLFSDQEEPQHAGPSRPTNTARQNINGSNKSHGKAPQVYELDDDDDEDDHDDDMIPITIDANGAIASDARIEEISREIESIDEQIANLRVARACLVEDRQTLLSQQRAAQGALRDKQRQTKKTSSAPPVPAPGSIDYSQSSQFKWKQKLDGILDRVFGIKALRLCQEGVLNAVLDGRDVICIMPTGGGKSVCFQAPALMSRGVTLVISPLLSLMADQVLALNAKGVAAVMITGSTSQQEIKEITQSLVSKDGKIKLCYVTPEKLAKSKTFANTLGKMYDAGLLARIAIDESHCCSQMGHDFRPDYKRLSMLKQLYPKTPIIALTATCGKAVLNDVVRILHLKSCTSGESAEPYKTVFFSAPLYRPNLHYSVRIKPVQVPALAAEMGDLIMTKYLNKAGIIYCLSQKETETFALAINDYTKGKVRIGTYHAGMDDAHKERIHKKWRKGEIKCVVATIAFGMGIDAPDVRYVFHQTISKSMEGYYQETGRAGRDGKDSDCILWFRPADASRLSSLTLSEAEGQKKLHNMLKYALDFKTCRKLMFDSYFGNPANVVAPFAESDRSVCGHCDNCLRNTNGNAVGEAGTVAADGKDGHDAVNALSSSSAAAGTSAAQEYMANQEILTRDVTHEAWKICKIISAADKKDARITLPGAAELCRGLGKCTFPTNREGNNKNANANAKATLNLEEVCGGKITNINKEDMESLLLQLIISGFLSEIFTQTAYSTNNYVTAGPQAVRLTRLKDQLDTSGIKIEFSSVGSTKKKKASSAAGKSKSKGKRKASGDGEDDEDDDNDEDEDSDNEADTDATGKGKGKAKAPAKRKRKSSKDTTSDASKEPKTKAKKATNRSKSKEKDDASAAPAKPAKRPKKMVTDSEEDWEDLGIGGPSKRPVPLPKKAQEMLNKDDDAEDHVDPDDFDLPEDDLGRYDDEDEQVDDDYPFVPDKFSKKGGSGTSKNHKHKDRSKSRELSTTSATTSTGTNVNGKSKFKQVIDLDTESE